MLTMTPKLRLSEQARKTLLSCMRKPFWPGKRRTTTSTQMMAAPKTQAAVRSVRTHQPFSATRRKARAWLQGERGRASRTRTAHEAHDPPPSVIIHLSRLHDRNRRPWHLSDSKGPKSGGWGTRPKIAHPVRRGGMPCRREGVRGPGGVVGGGRGNADMAWRLAIYKQQILYWVALGQRLHGCNT